MSDWYWKKYYAQPLLFSRDNGESWGNVQNFLSVDFENEGSVKELQGFVGPWGRYHMFCLKGGGAIYTNNEFKDFRRFSGSGIYSLIYCNHRINVDLDESG